MFYKIMLKSFLKLVAFVTAVLSLSILVGITDDEIAQYKLLIEYWWLFGLAYCGLFIYYAVLYLCSNQIHKSSSINIHNFAHILRNFVLENTSSKMICNAYEFRTKNKLLCEEICEFIKKEYGKKDVSVSIKLVQPWGEQQDEESILKKDVRTLCCAGSNYNPNTKNKKEKVSDYTAFEDILLRRNNFKDIEKTTFVCSNLSMARRVWRIMDKAQYKGCSGDCKSTVVVPIRVNLDSIKIEEKECYKGYKTYGFICIECKKTYSKATIGKIADYVCSFADYLCVYFSNAYKQNFFDEYSKSETITI